MGTDRKKLVSTDVSGSRMFRTYTQCVRYSFRALAILSPQNHLANHERYVGIAKGKLRSHTILFMKNILNMHDIAIGNAK